MTCAAAGHVLPPCSARTFPIMPRVIDRCRVCGNRDLVQVVDLGEQALTGVFPRTREQIVTSGPLRLVKCSGDADACGLLQLQHSYDLQEMYGKNYGYRSALNSSMVSHLHGKVQRILDLGTLRHGDLVIDIGSNDATTLRAYPPGEYSLVGIDPTGAKFREYYPAHVELLPDFFSLELVRRHCGERMAKVVTSFAMFYDLEQPLRFMQEVHDVLDDEGIWMLEQSYMPRMLEINSYDTICHEHLEYYGLKQIKWMADHVGFRIIHVEMNDVNGGSFSITVAKNRAPYPNATNLDDLIATEMRLGLEGLKPYLAFAKRIDRSRQELRDFLAKAKAAGKSVYGLGASTKGNVILQYCGITETDLPLIGEVNSDKYGCFTPGTLIPIVPEDELLARKPDYLLALPWHFRGFFETNLKLKRTELVFPLPTLEVLIRGRFHDRAT